MPHTKLGRRDVLGASFLALTVAHSRSATAMTEHHIDTPHIYEVQRSATDWRTQLTDGEHFILREGGTEQPHSHRYWKLKEVGTYRCKGCDLTIFDSVQKLDITKGWVFFRHSRADAVLTGLDTPDGRSLGDPFAAMQALMEVHCRRCGSHLGHLVSLGEVPGRPIHCINGLALMFERAAI